MVESTGGTAVGKDGEASERPEPPTTLMAASGAAPGEPPTKPLEVERPAAPVDRDEGPPAPAERPEPVWPGLTAAGLPTRVPHQGDEEAIKEAFFESWESGPTSPTPLTRTPFTPTYLTEPPRPRAWRGDIEPTTLLRPEGTASESSAGGGSAPSASMPDTKEPPEPKEPPDPKEPPEPRRPPEPKEPPRPPEPPGPSPFPSPTPMPTPPEPVHPSPVPSPVPPGPPSPPVPAPPPPFPPPPGPVPPPPSIAPPPPPKAAQAAQESVAAPPEPPVAPAAPVSPGLPVAPVLPKPPVPPPAIVPGATRVPPDASTGIAPETSTRTRPASRAPHETATRAAPPRPAHPLPAIGTSTYQGGNYTDLVTEPITGVVAAEGGPTEPIEMSGSLTGHLLARNQEMYRRRERRRKLRTFLWVSFGLVLFGVGIAVVVNMLAGDFIRSIFDTFSDWAG